MSGTLKIYNGTLICPHRCIKEGTLIIKDGKIVELGSKNVEVEADALQIDAQGNFIAPGFIDIHVHGGGGCDFMDGEIDDFLTIAETHARYGTTAMTPTTLTSEKEGLVKVLSNYEQASVKNLKGARFLGMHLEGPYFLLNQRGAQDPKFIRNPDPKEYKEIIERFGKSIARWSAAPELPGALAFGRYLRDHGILAAFAHTGADYDAIVAAFENGYTLATHFYSAMSGVFRKNAYRYAGVIESTYLIDEIDVEVIADGRHLPAALLKLVYKIKGPDRIALITDAMRGAATTASETILGDKKNGITVIIEDEVAQLPDRSAFAGSIATTNRLVKNMVHMAEIPLVEAVRMQTYTPARIMGWERLKGSLAVGKDADVVVFDNNVDVRYTIVEGKLVYQKV